MSDEKTKLLQTAEQVLKLNDQGKWMMPSVKLYPHQWLWDSCFIAIGLRHQNIERAKTELQSLLDAQWSNGMVPNIVFANGKQHKREHNLWRSYLNPHAPDGVITSGITQPPVIAEAAVRIGQKLSVPERRSWYSKVFPNLLRYHEWLYRERDPDKTGLVVLLHPYESGLDNSPPCISELRKYGFPWWIKAVEKMHLDWLINYIRTDTRNLPPRQRMKNADAVAYWNLLLRLRRKAYDSKQILLHPSFAVEDLAFNCMLIRANHNLKEIAKAIGEKLPRTLTATMDATAQNLENLWHQESGKYLSRSFISKDLIIEATVASLLPLYAGNISVERAESLVKLLDKRKLFASDWPLPSVPLSDGHFDPWRSWQGPSWININWLIIDGLRRYGFDQEASQLKDKTLKLVAKSGFYEYFNPLTGEPAGAPLFSWTAALTIDLLKN